MGTMIRQPPFKLVAWLGGPAAESFAELHQLQARVAEVRQTPALGRELKLALNEKRYECARIYLSLMRARFQSHTGEEILGDEIIEFTRQQIAYLAGETTNVEDANLLLDVRNGVPESLRPVCDQAALEIYQRSYRQVIPPVVPVTPEDESKCALVVEGERHLFASPLDALRWLAVQEESADRQLDAQLHMLHTPPMPPIRPRRP